MAASFKEKKKDCISVSSLASKYQNVPFTSSEDYIYHIIIGFGI